MFLWHSKKYKTPEISEERKTALRNHAAKYNIPISRFDLWDLALTHISYIDKSNPLSYERMEFLGDSVLGLCMADILFDEYADLSEGKMSVIKSNLVNEKTLYELSVELQLIEVINLGSGEKLRDKRAREKVLCDIFESTLATIYIQHGFKKCRDFIRTMLGSRINTILEEGVKDAKTRLQRIAIRLYKEYPAYEVVDTEGPDHGKIFTVKCISGPFEGAAKGRSKKEAEQRSAGVILEKMHEYSLAQGDEALAKELAQIEL